MADWPVIVLDPGHGGPDPGAAGQNIWEKHLVLDVARQVRLLLSFYRAKVYLTRDDDVEVSLSERVSYANRLKADCFLSIHVNAGGGSGFESYIYTLAGSKTVEFQKTVHAAVASYYAAAGFADRGMKRAGFAVLRDTRMPALLLENLFIDSSRDAAALADPAFRKGAAGAIAAGLVAHLSLLPAGGWDPAKEVEALLAAGLINSPHDPAETLRWGEFAAVANRLRQKSSAAGPWNPYAEISLLRRDGLIYFGRDPYRAVCWGEFAGVINGLAQNGTAGRWDLAAEVEKLRSSGLIFEDHPPEAPVSWGEMATVVNRLREKLK